MKNLIQDLKFGFRMLLRKPGFSIIAILTLALGIGANTTIFSFVNGILLSPLSYKESDKLVVPTSFNLSTGDENGSITYADYLDWKNADIFDHVSVLDLLNSADLSSGEGEPERVKLAFVSEEYFSVMGLDALVGRTFVPEDYKLGPPASLVITYALWQRRFGGDPGIPGQKIYLNGRPYPVAGVMPQNATWPTDCDVFLPFAVGPNPQSNPDLMRRDNQIFSAIARLKPEVPLKQVDATMAAIAARVAQENPESRKETSNRAIGLRDYVVGTQSRSSLIILLAVVGFVLLIACVNVANLMLVRAAAREREMAIRLAIGAGRFRLIRQMLTESLLLTLIGGAAGVLVSVWGVELLKNVAPADTPRLADVQLSGRVLLFAFVAALITSAICGLIPALQSSRADLQTALKESSRSSTGGTRSRFIRNTLVVSELALSLILMVGAGLAIRSFIRVLKIDPGVQADRLVTMTLYARGIQYPKGNDVANFYKRIIESVKEAPGVESAAVSSALPLGGGGFYLGRSFVIEGHADPPAEPDFQGQWNVVSPGYFSTSGTALLRGRDFDDRDRGDGNQVVIINSTLAHRMFGDDDPLGRRIRSWRDENVQREIIGVVEDVRYLGQDDKLRGLVYVPHTQNSWRSMTLTVKTQMNPALATSAIRGQIAAVDKELAVANIETMTTILNRSVAPRRAVMMLLIGFGIIAAVLAVIGIYGVLSYTVANRVQEIGVRIALGAQSSDVLRMVVVQGMKLTVLGIGFGAAASWVLTRFMSSLLYEVSATDFATFAAVSLLLTVVAVMACLVPAFRASRVDPLIALRYE